MNARPGASMTPTRGRRCQSTPTPPRRSSPPEPRPRTGTQTASSCTTGTTARMTPPRRPPGWRRASNCTAPAGWPASASARANSPAQPGDQRIERSQGLLLLRRSGVLEIRHVRALVGEQKELDRNVLVDVGLRQEHSDLATGCLLDHAREAVGHLLLKPPADVLDRLALATLDERLLSARERLLQHDDDDVIDDVGPRLGGALAVVLGLEADDPPRDRRPRLAQRLLIVSTHRSNARIPARPRGNRSDAPGIRAGPPPVGG